MVKLLLLVASTYGAGSYGGGAYGAGTLLQVGPLSLPDTGAGWMVLISAGLVALSAGWATWLWQRRRARLKKLTL